MIEHSAMKFDQKLQRWARSQNTVLDHKKFTRQITETVRLQV